MVPPLKWALNLNFFFDKNPKYCNYYSSILSILGVMQNLNYPGLFGDFLIVSEEIMLKSLISNNF